MTESAELTVVSLTVNAPTAGLVVRPGTRAAPSRSAPPALCTARPGDDAGGDGRGRAHPRQPVRRPGAGHVGLQSALTLGADHHLGGAGALGRTGCADAADVHPRWGGR